MVMERWRPSAMGPWRSRRLMEDLDRFLEEGFPNWALPSTWRRFPTEEMAWAPAMEVYEKDENFVVRAELPGVSMEDIDISMTGDTLTIKGERKASEEVKDEQYYRCEVCYGSFSRSVVMPTAVDAEKIEASYHEGILEINLPKAAEAQPRRIQVTAK